MKERTRAHKADMNEGEGGRVRERERERISPKKFPREYRMPLDLWLSFDGTAKSECRKLECSYLRAANECNEWWLGVSIAG